MAAGEKTYRLYSTVQSQQIEWLWYPYIPYGKITLLQGDPGDGKSTCMINIAAALSVGGTLPDGSRLPKPHHVIYQCAEDNVNDTIKPRLEQAGADCGKIAFIEKNEAEVSLLDSRIEDTIEKLNVRLVIIDPIQAFLMQGCNMNSATRMRRVLNQLAYTADKYHCAVVLIGHMNKTSGGKELYRGLGSIDIPALARSVLMVSRDKKNPSIRYLSQLKSNLALEGETFAFTIGSSFGFQWIGRCVVEGSSLCDSGESSAKKTKLQKAEEMVKIMLSAGGMPAKEILERMHHMGISERTVRSAVKEIGIRAYRKKKTWYWSMGGDQDEAADGDG